MCQMFKDLFLAIFNVSILLVTMSAKLNKLYVMRIESSPHIYTLYLSINHIWFFDETFQTLLWS